MSAMFGRSAEQQVFEETTQRFLDAEWPLTTVRALGATDTGSDPGTWRRGAELGWTSAVVPESAGGGSVSGRGVLDLALVAHQFGRHAAPGPLIGTNVVAAALGRWGTTEHQEGPLAELLRGAAVAAWAVPGAWPGGTAGFRLHADADGVVLEGRAAPVEGGSDASYILVTARQGTGVRQVLVSRTADALRVTALRGLDMTKRFALVESQGTRLPDSALVGPAGEAAGAARWLGDLAATLALAEMCGAMGWAFDTTTAWSRDRYSFGRPLASYQAIKHRLADMKMWLEAGLAITARAADAVDRDSPDRSELVSAAKWFVSRYGVELLQECVQLHGGIGLTFEHDLHLFLRRVVTDAALWGTAGQHAVRLTELLDARVPA
jgi:alkylation response protein AidB-like acyl-CoA dehydrogenase